MKKVLLSLALMLFSCLAFSQEQFQGNWKASGELTTDVSAGSPESSAARRIVKGVSYTPKDGYLNYSRL